jgi:hypothetical protein
MQPSERRRHAIVMPVAGPQLQLVALDDPRVTREAFKTMLPLYTLKAAAGYFERKVGSDLHSAGSTGTLRAQECVLASSARLAPMALS